MFKSEAIEQLAFCQIPDGTKLRRTTEGSTVVTLIDSADPVQLEGIAILAAEHRAEVLGNFTLDVPETTDLTADHLRKLAEAIDLTAKLDRDGTPRTQFETLEAIEQRRLAMHKRLSGIAETLGFTL